MMMRVGGLIGLVLALAPAATAQIGYLWTMDELTKQSDLVVIAEHDSTTEVRRGAVHPELKPALPVIEMDSVFVVPDMPFAGRVPSASQATPPSA